MRTQRPPLLNAAEPLWRWDHNVIPAPISDSSGASSKTAAFMPTLRKARTATNPPIPPPIIRTLLPFRIASVRLVTSRDSCMEICFRPTMNKLLGPAWASFLLGILDLLQHVFCILICCISRKSPLVVLFRPFQISRLHVRLRKAVPDIAGLWKFRRVQPDDLD